MRRFLSRPGMPPAVAGFAILLQAALARVLLQADEARVYLLGHPLNWACSFHEHFGLPCPTCGLTRSVILTLHGQLQRAWRMAPGGPALTLGILFVAAGVLLLAGVELWSYSRSTNARWLEHRIKMGLQAGALGYAGVSTVVWLTGWAAQFSAALRAVH
jgi:hypothetical protein